jgi:uncharacterized protein
LGVIQELYPNDKHKDKEQKIMSTNPYFVIYRDTSGEYRWRLRDSNNEIIAVSGEGYQSHWSCERAVGNVRAAVPSATLVDMTR